MQSTIFGVWLTLGCSIVCQKIDEEQIACDLETFGQQHVNEHCNDTRKANAQKISLRLVAVVFLQMCTLICLHLVTSIFIFAGNYT